MHGRPCRQELEQKRDVHIGCEVCRPRPRAGRQSVSPGRVGDQACEDFGGRLGVVQGPEEAIDVVANDFGYAADPRRNDRNSNGHSLHDGDAEALDLRRVHEESWSSTISRTSDR